MSASVKQFTASDAATQELWRVAESGEVDELGRVFSNGAHVNARNKHGMTALMRAAYHGHALMVRSLLEHGADPNVARNDKFTALALAAFFGHTETVKILVQHGARTDVLTRCGASAQTWATRRTCVEAARCLESQDPKPKPAPAPSPAPAAAPVVIKTLKDPPEIWDLVHEVPRGSFNAGSAFVSRLKSTSFAFRAAAVLIVSAACVVGVMLFRGSQARSLPAGTPANQSVVATQAEAPVKVENTANETPVVSSTSEPNGFSHHSEPLSVGDKPSRKGGLPRQTRSRAARVEEPLTSAQNREVPVPPPVISTTPVEPRKTPNSANSGLSPQLIAPAKSATPKGKVIQWP